ncbi:MAG: hypothetical protein ACUVQ0_01530 [Thermoproteota archaeon]
MSLRNVTCLNCNATIAIPQEASIVVCPYCGHTFEVYTGKKWEYYMFPAYIDSSSAWRRVMQFILRRYGVPSDFNAEANMRSAELYNVPYHVFSCRAYSSCSYGGRYASYIETRSVSISAARTGTWLDSFTRELSFSVRGRGFFDPRQAQRSRFYMPTMSFQEAYDIAHSLIISQAAYEARRSCSGFREVDKVEVNYLGLVHYPLWLMEYTYRNSFYRILMDASGGRILFVEYPLSSRSRRVLLAGSLGLLAMGILSGLLAAAVLSPLGLIGGLASSVIVASPLLAKALSIKVKGSEVISQREWSTDVRRGVETLMGIGGFRLLMVE